MVNQTGWWFVLRFVRAWVRHYLFWGKDGVGAVYHRWLGNIQQGLDFRSSSSPQILLLWKRPLATFIRRRGGHLSRYSKTLFHCRHLLFDFSRTWQHRICYLRRERSVVSREMWRPRVKTEKLTVERGTCSIGEQSSRWHWDSSTRLLAPADSICNLVGW